jgi:hypothetical protein
MAQRNARPFSWAPKGLSDVLDASNAFRGSMSSLQNLIPDPSTPQLWQCRPASLIATNFIGGGFSSGFSSGFQVSTLFSSPGQISCNLIVGNLVFGMIPTALNPGHDQPFCYNLSTNTFVLVTGTQNTSTTPVSLTTTGDWVPPQMEIIGSKVMVCHQGFASTGNMIGWFDISTPSTPVWHAGNFTGPAGLTFTVPPTDIAQFNGRAYYIHNNPSQPAVIWSDVFNPIANTGSVTPVLTFGDTNLLTSINPLPLSNLLGGVISSLMVFKGATSIYQITGDSSTNNLLVQSLNVQTGTFGSNAVAPTPKGLAFIAPDGLRVINFQAQVSDPIGMDGKGVNVPFQNVLYPTRTCMASNTNILRISLFNGNVANAPLQEYWYDFARSIFHGPHTFPASLIQPYLNTFIMQPGSVPGSLWNSPSIQTLTSTFVENGQQMTWQAFTSFLPSGQEVVNYAMTEATIDLALAAGVPPIDISAVDENLSVIDTVGISGQAGATIWGQFTWGSPSVWGGPASLLAPRQLQWHLPIVFAKMQLQASGQSAQAVKVGKIEALLQKLKIQTNIAAAA